MTRVIGIVGGSGSGKTTATNILLRLLHGTEYALAAPIKRVAASLYDFSDEQLNGPQVVKEAVDPRVGVSPRQAMRRIGDALADEFGRDFLVDHALGRIAREAPTVAVISDVRKLSEARAVRSFASNSVLIRMNYIPGLAPTASDHATETEWRQIACDVDVAPPRVDLEYLERMLEVVCDTYRLQVLYQRH